MTAYTHHAALLLGFAGLVGILWTNPPAIAEQPDPVHTAAVRPASGFAVIKPAP